MKESNKLFELISSMSKSEKVYFKRYTSMHVKGEENNYIKLFDAYASQEEFEEKKVRAKLKNNPALKYFSSSQAYLYKLILKCLRAYHSDESSDTKTMELVLDSVFLKDRGLFEQSSNAMENARVLALENEDLIYLLKAYDTRQENSFRSPEIKKFEMLEKETYPLALQLIDKIKEKIEINFLLNKTYPLYLKYGENTTDKTAIGRVSEMLAHPLLKPNMKYQTRNNLYRALSIKSFLYYILGDFHSLKTINEIHLSALKKNPQFNAEHITCNYAILLCNKLMICHQLGKAEELETTFNKVRSINFESQLYEILVFGNAYTNIMEAYTDLNMVNKALTLIPEITKKLKKYEGKVPVEVLFVLESEIAIVYFMAGNYSYSLKWINKVLNSNNNIREDIQIELRMLNIFVHYELKNFQLMASLVISLQRHLSKLKKLDAFTKTICDHMKKLEFMMDKKEIQTEFLSFEKDLKVIMKSRRYKQSYILAWIEKRVK
jgi:hypothetical protein